MSEHRLRLTQRGRRVRAACILVLLIVMAVLVWWYDTTWAWVPA